MDSGTGAGVCCSSDGTSLYSSLEEFTTVFQAEVYAIIICSTTCIDNGYSGTSINICSDSQAALLALQKCAMTSKLV